VDYKNARLLSQFLSPFTGKVYEKNITGKTVFSSFQQFLFIYSLFIGLCKTKQKIVEGEIIKAQNAGYLAIMLKKVEYLKDPKLYDPNRPVRPHRY
jgi:small subunit ribosomal protein S18